MNLFEFYIYWSDSVTPANEKVGRTSPLMNWQETKLRMKMKRSWIEKRWEWKSKKWKWKEVKGKGLIGLKGIEVGEVLKEQSVNVMSHHLAQWCLLIPSIQFSNKIWLKRTEGIIVLVNAVLMLVLQCSVVLAKYKLFPHIVFDGSLALPYQYS